MLVATATGVATYARALRAAQQALAEEAAGDALLLSGGAASAPGSPQSRADRWLRIARAVLPVNVRAGSDDPDRDSGTFVHHDLFRLGQSFFDVHGRLLPVRVPGPPGIMHWSYPVPLYVVGWRNLYTVHDVIPLTHPELSPIDPTRHHRLLRRITARADKLVAVSRAAAADIAAVLEIPEERVIDCSQPVTVESDLRTLGDLASLPAGLEAGRYLLVCGAIEPRKNLSRILAAYRQSGTALPLVIAGPDGWRAEEITAALYDTPGVIRLPYQSRTAIVALLAGARALLMPSLAEGFGLPVAEAMALGTPVVTSSAGDWGWSALAETAGDAALLVDPHDTNAITATIARVACDNALCARLRDAGRKNARRFDVASFAERLGALYDSLGTTD